MTTHETPEANEPAAWTNEAILRHLLRTVLTAIYDQPDSLLDAV